jgi:hypothetical protein
MSPWQIATAVSSLQACYTDACDAANLLDTMSINYRWDFRVSRRLVSCRPYRLTNKLTNPTEQASSWEANGCLASKGTARGSGSREDITDLRVPWTAERLSACPEGLGRGDCCNHSYAWRSVVRCRRDVWYWSPCETSWGSDPQPFILTNLLFVVSGHNENEGRGSPVSRAAVSLSCSSSSLFPLRRGAHAYLISPDGRSYDRPWPLPLVTCQVTWSMRKQLFRKGAGAGRKSRH